MAMVPLKICLKAASAKTPRNHSTQPSIKLASLFATYRISAPSNPSKPSAIVAYVSTYFLIKIYAAVDIADES